MTAFGDLKLDPPALRKAADARWSAYKSTCCMGDTAEQRRWACDQAVKAELAAQAGAIAVRSKAPAVAA